MYDQRACRTPAATKQHAIIGLIALFAVLISILYSRGSVVLGDDASMYIVVANALSAGDGVLSNIVQPIAGSPRDRVTIWPPGFPALEAVFIWFGVPGPLAAQIVTFSALALLVGLVARVNWVAFGFCAGLLAAVITALQPRLWSLAVTATSELPFLCVIAAVPLIVTAHTSTRRIVGLSLVFTVAFYLRYAGVCLIIAVVALALLPVLRRPLKTSEVAYGIAIASVPIVALLVHNLTISGFLSGGNRLPSEHGLLIVVLDAGTGLLEMFLPLFIIDVVKSHMLVRALVGSITMSTFFMLAWWSSRQSQATYLHVNAVIAAVYVVTIIALRSVSAFDDLNARLMSPVIPFLVMALVAACGAMPAAWRFSAVAATLGTVTVIAGANLVVGLHIEGKAAVAEAAVAMIASIPKGARVGTPDSLRVAPYLPPRIVVSLEAATSLAEGRSLCRVAGCDYILVLPRYRERRGTATEFDSAWLDDQRIPTDSTRFKLINVVPEVPSR